VEITVKEAELWQRNVAIVVGNDELQPDFERALKKYQKNAKMQGFRKGKVPIPVIKKLYGEAIEYEVIEKVLPKFLMLACREKQLKIAAPARLEDQKYTPGQGLEATFTVEVEPEFELKKYENFKLVSQVYASSDDDINGALERVREENAVWKTSDEAVTDEDYIKVDLQELDETGVPIIGKKHVDQYFQVKDKDGEYTEIGRQLLNSNVGDVKIVSLTPESDAESDAPVEPVSVEVKLNEISRKILPDLDDELAKDVGDFENLEELKKAIEAQISASMKQNFEKNLHQQLIDELIKNNPVDLPDGMVDHYLDTLIENAKKEKNEGLGQMTDDQIRTLYRVGAVWNIKWRLIRQKLVDMHSIEANEADVKAWIDESAEARKFDAKRTWNRVKNDKEQMEQLQSDILEKKIMDFLLERQKIKEKKVSRADLEKQDPAAMA